MSLCDIYLGLVYLWINANFQKIEVKLVKKNTTSLTEKMNTVLDDKWLD